MKLNTIPEAISDIKKGKLIIVVDDEDRENEGDFITAARNVTPAVINFMATVGRGLICMPMSEEMCERLDLPMMVSKNSSNHETAFTVSVDLPRVLLLVRPGRRTLPGLDRKSVV